MEKNLFWFNLVAKIASTWMLSGKTLLELWNLLLTIKKTSQAAFQELLKNSSELWSEIKLFVGYKLPAKDA